MAVDLCMIMIMVRTVPVMVMEVGVMVVVPGGNSGDETGGDSTSFEVLNYGGIW
jgi:hypothetical protein